MAPDHVPAQSELERGPERAVTGKTFYPVSEQGKRAVNFLGRTVGPLPVRVRIRILASALARESTL